MMRISDTSVQISGLFYVTVRFKIRIGYSNIRLKIRYPVQVDFIWNTQLNFTLPLFLTGYHDIHHTERIHFPMQVNTISNSAFVVWL